MDNFKDINCRIVNIHGRISCQTGVRVSIFRLCRCIYRDTVQVQVNLLSIYRIAFMLRNVNSQTNVKIDINYVIDNQNMQENNNNKKLGIFIFESDIFVN